MNSRSHLKDNMKMIFSTILDWKMQADGYPAEVTSLSKKIVAGTLEVYKAAVQSLLPTPLKASELLRKTVHRSSLVGSCFDHCVDVRCTTHSTCETLPRSSLVCCS